MRVHGSKASGYFRMDVVQSLFGRVAVARCRQDACAGRGLRTSLLRDFDYTTGVAEITLILTASNAVFQNIDRLKYPQKATEKSPTYQNQCNPTNLFPLQLRFPVSCWH
jgi:hypothetical protein